MTPILQLRGIQKHYTGPSGRLDVLRGIDLELGAGDFLALRGASGCGKSTLLSIAGGLLTPDKGEVLLQGENLHPGGGKTRGLRRAAHIGYVFQRFHLLSYLTVEENIRAAALALPSGVPVERAAELLDTLGLRERRHHLPEQLSVGEQQRVAVARALANRPGLLLADEPTGNLDPDNSAILLDAFTRFAAEGGAVLMVTHEETVAARAARVLHLRKGTMTS